MTNPDNHSSMAKKAFQGVQRPEASEHEKLGRYYVGNKVRIMIMDNLSWFIKKIGNTNIQ